MSTQPLYPNSHSERRQIETPSERLSPEEYRTPWRIDYARILHSPCFRRLQGKNQLLPSTDSDFFRNRLTHSLEVAQISHSIADRLNHEFLAKHNYSINVDLCEAAALAHDLGHPPFGHQGECALNNIMKGNGGYEGNAQTFRILTKLEKKFQSEQPQLDADRLGLNLCYRTLASIVKNDNVIPQDLPTDENGNAEKIKGVYLCDSHILDDIKNKLASVDCQLKTVEEQIMDIADDIAYSNYDLEDAMKGGVLSPLSIAFPNFDSLKKILWSMTEFLGKPFNYGDFEREIQELFGDFSPNSGPSSSFYDDVYAAYLSSKWTKENGYFRTKVTSYIIGMFIRGISIKEVNEERPWLSQIHIDENVLLKIELLKKITLYSIILTPKMEARNFQAAEMIERMFDAVLNNPKLLPDDSADMYASVSVDLQKRVVCDFIAGMTDKYAFEFYKRLFYPSNKSFFEPHW
jgi:dGTPase